MARIQLSATLGLALPACHVAIDVQRTITLKHMKKEGVILNQVLKQEVRKSVFSSYDLNTYLLELDHGN